MTFETLVEAARVEPVTFTVDGVNLVDEKIVQFDTDRFRPRAVYDNGRYYFVGFRFQL